MTHSDQKNSQQQERLVPGKYLYFILKHSESVDLYEREAVQD